jgi:hypothetical protein
MTRTAKPVVHRRDHEHGGADPVRITWEQTGETGGGTGIQFDVINTGDWIEIDTTSVNPDNSVGQLYYATGQMQLFSDDEITIAGNEVLISSSGAGITIDASHVGDNLNLRVNHSNGSYLILTGLPTSDPGTPGAIWNNSGVLSIS